MGLGPYPEVSLKEAREQAEAWRAVVRQGQDPIKERARLRRIATRNLHVLNEVALDAFESRKAALKRDGKAGRWFSPLELHVLPKLGRMPVSEIDQIDIRDTIKPIWHSKAATAKKAINRLGIVLQHAAALGIEVDLQATEKAKALLGAQRHKERHIPAMPWQEVPEFFASLNDGTNVQLALRLLILTGVRSYPVRFATIDQFESGIWTIPAQSIKGRKNATEDFRVPLSTRALKLVEEASVNVRDHFLFPSPRKGVISDAAMSRLMERRGLTYRPHGFRSSFRDWVAEKTSTAFEVAETALGHSVGRSVERAYRRTDYLEQRAVLMQRWDDYVFGEVTQIVKIGKVQKSSD